LEGKEEREVGTGMEGKEGKTFIISFTCVKKRDNGTELVNCESPVLR
jgi:hypothetical protein